MDEIIDINTLFGPLPVASTDLAVDALITLMQKHGVGAACALSTLGVLLDPTMGNAATRAACADHPQLLPVATLNPMMFFGDTAPLLRLGSDGFALVRLFPAMQGWPIDLMQFYALADALRPTDLPIMVGIEKPGDITALTRVLGEYPAPVVLSGVDAGLLAEAVAALRAYDNWHLETSHLLALGSIQLLASTVGVERVLFGTGAPSRPIAGALHTLQYVGLSEEAYHLVLAGNARRIMKLN